MIGATGWRRCWTRVLSGISRCSAVGSPALVATVWLPLALLIGLFQGFGLLANALQWPFGDPVEPLSALAFLTIDAVPMLTLWCALVFLLAVALRNRLVVALVAIAAVGAHWWLLTRSPGYLLPVVSGLTGYTVTPSDVMPTFAAATDIAQRAGLLLLAGGLLVLGAALHPRRDRASSSGQYAVAGRAACRRLRGAWRAGMASGGCARCPRCVADRARGAPIGPQGPIWNGCKGRFPSIRAGISRLS